MKFTKRETGGYTVTSADIIVGIVKSSEHWTVRGSKKLWLAYRKGTCIGEFQSRYYAGAFLANRTK